MTVIILVDIKMVNKFYEQFLFLCCLFVWLFAICCPSCSSLVIYSKVFMYTFLSDQYAVNINEWKKKPALDRREKRKTREEKKLVSRDVWIGSLLIWWYSSFCIFTWDFLSWIPNLRVTICDFCRPMSWE